MNNIVHVDDDAHFVAKMEALKSGATVQDWVTALILKHKPKERAR